MSKKNIFLSKARFILIGFLLLTILPMQAQTEVGLYRTFEHSVVNNNSYSNKFADVELTTTFTSPSGIQTDFIGFFDGDGNGGGNKESGNVWKFRFLPNELGTWSYSWSWSDGSQGGQGTFSCVSANAGKGILRAYENNPRWFAYNGTEPVWIKSYYESGHGSIGQPLDWLAENVYQPMIDRGYNHFQVNWLLSLCCFDQYYHDGPAQSTSDLALYDDGKASSTMNLNVWQLMEQNVDWLNDKNVGLHMFLGFDGSRNGGPEWDNLSDYEKDFYVKYVIARLAPYANIAGWSFVWEVAGDRESYELGWARLVKQYDVFDHLRTYQDEAPGSNEYDRPEYNFAAVENHYMYSSSRDSDFPYWKSAWTHHEACKVSYVTGKPVIMIEGNALWRRYWAEKVGATQDDLRQSAWGCATAGASFIWCGHQGQDDLVAFGYEGLPFYGDVNPYASSAAEIDVLTEVMENEVSFYRMTPSDNLLSDHDTWKVWCLSEPGEQYLVFSLGGSSFMLQLASGQYNNNLWVDTKTGATTPISAITSTNSQTFSFNPPNTTTDWVLLVRQGEAEPGKPTAAITSPSNGDTFNEPANITINADASDSDGAITSVEFFQGTTSLGVDYSAPYSVDWNNVPAGDFSLTARATDNDNQTGTSYAVNITVEPDMGGYSYCSDEGQICTFSGTVDVMYGADGQYNFLYGLTSGSVSCDNSTFGDPISGVVKSCYVKQVGTTTTTYSLSTSINGQGSVSPSSGDYNDGSVVSLSAIADAGWVFDSWSGDASGSGNPVSITMDANKSVTANFSETTNQTTVTIQENETGFCSVDGSIDNNNGGFTGDGFANTDNASGKGITWSVNIPASGNYNLIWRYANGGSTDRTAQLMVDGTIIVSGVSMPSTGSWTSWTETSAINVNLSAGTKLIRLQATNSSGLGNMDCITISGGSISAVACTGLKSAATANEMADEDIRFYPVPVDDLLSIQFNRELTETVDVYLYDVTGKIVKSSMAKGSNHSLDMSDLPNGLYTVRISGENLNAIEHVVKK